MKLIFLFTLVVALSSCAMDYTDSTGAAVPLISSAPIKITFQNPFSTNGAAVPLPALPTLPTSGTLIPIATLPPPTLAPAPAALSAPSSH